MDKDFARGERMMRRPDLQQGQQSETDQLQNSSLQRSRFKPSWAKQGSAWDTSDDDVLPPIPAHLKTNAWTKKNVQLDQTPLVLSNAYVSQPQQLGQGSQPQLVAQVPAQPKGAWQTDYVIHPGSKDGTIKMIYATPGPYGEGEGQRDVKNKLWPANAQESDTLHKGALPSSRSLNFDGQIIRQDAKGNKVTIPFKKGVPVNLKPGDQIQHFVKDQPGKSKLTQRQRDEAIKKMPYGDKLVDAAEMVPDLLKKDVKAAFQKIISDPGFVVQLGATAAAFVALQLTPAGPFINGALIAVLGLSGGLSLANYLLKAHSAKDEAGLRAAAGELKNLVEIVGIAALSGALGTAGKVLGRMKGGATATQAARQILFKEMTKAGVKFTPENVLKVARAQNGKIVFLEKGTIAEGSKPAGLAHILKGHSKDFAGIGISESQIPEVIMTAATQGRKIGTQGRSRGIYETLVDGQKKYIAVEISNNGFIVSANPAKSKDVSKFLRGANE